MFWSSPEFGFLVQNLFETDGSQEEGKISVSREPNELVGKYVKQNLKNRHLNVDE